MEEIGLVTPTPGRSKLLPFGLVHPKQFGGNGVIKCITTRLLNDYVAYYIARKIAIT